MKNATYLILVLSVIVAITVLTSIDLSEALPAPEPRKIIRPGRRNNCTNWFGSCETRTDSSGSSRLDGSKSVYLDINAYRAYQHRGYGGSYNDGQRYGSRKWNNGKKLDGFKCRSDKECSWRDHRLYCQHYEFYEKFTTSVSFSALSRLITSRIFLRKVFVSFKELQLFNSIILENS